MRKQHALLFICSLLTGAFGVPTGCGGGDSCISVCEKSNACDGAEQDDCEMLCADARAEADMAGCRDEFEDANDCIDGVSDICATQEGESTECLAEALAVFSCTFDGEITF